MRNGWRPHASLWVYPLTPGTGKRTAGPFIQGLTVCVRQVSPEEKLRIYIRIVRLLLEEGEHGQAETYYNRAALLIHSTNDRELQLSFKLCQARIADFNRKFYDAALRYNELSWMAELDEEDRANALSAAVTCAVLAPAGPKRSRVLATLFRDERAASLENYTILRKMFNDHIIRPEEVKGFEETLKPHHLARVAQSQNDKLAARSTAADDDGDTDMTDADTPQSTRTGPATVLDKAVLEHNLLSASKIYNNITFSGLGALLDLAPAAAETMARRMIEQGRLHASIDQVARLISFETTHDPRQDDAAGGAGGLGDVVQEVEDTGAPETDKWDLQIKRTAANVCVVGLRMLLKAHHSLLFRLRELCSTCEKSSSFQFLEASNVFFVMSYFTTKQID